MSTPFTVEPITQPIFCQHKSSTTNPTYAYHRHDGYEILIFIEGNVHFYQGSNCYSLTSGNLILLSPKHMHRIQSFSNTRYERIVIYLQPAILAELSSSITDLSLCFSTDETMPIRPICLSPEQLLDIIQLSHLLEKSLNSNEYAADLRAKIYLTEILLLANECEQNVSPQPNIMPELVQNIMSYIERNLSNQILLQDLAKRFFVSETQIRRLFKKHTGLTLRDYILAQRIHKAKYLLKSGKNVSEACYASGFCDYANFIRSFKKIVGITPGHYKNSCFTDIPPFQ